MDTGIPHRERTRRVMIGDIPVGGGAPVSIQSMTLASPVDVRASIEEIQRLAEAGVEIVRTAVPNEAAAECLPELVNASPVPLVADIHFNYQLAIKAAEAGVAKLRLNPGNIGDSKRVRAVVDAAGQAGRGVGVLSTCSAGGAKLCRSTNEPRRALHLAAKLCRRP